MTTALSQIRECSSCIQENIEKLGDEPGLLAQNTLSQLRNLLEALMVYFENNCQDINFNYERIKRAVKHSKRTSQSRCLSSLHDRLKESTSHYTLDAESSTRLMLAYIQDLLEVREFSERVLKLTILDNLESYPVLPDEASLTYYRSAVTAFKNIYQTTDAQGTNGVYYIYDTKPLFIDSEIWYEVSYVPAHDNVKPGDRRVGISRTKISNYYAVSLHIHRIKIALGHETAPANCIVSHKVSIRPCELSNFIRLFIENGGTAQRGQKFYSPLMDELTRTGDSLLSYVENNGGKLPELLTDSRLSDNTSLNLYHCLQTAQKIINENLPGAQVLRYILVNFSNTVIKKQFQHEPNTSLSNLRLQYGCIPFDEQPYCSSLIGHNPKYHTVRSAIPADGREHEEVARQVKNNQERSGEMFTKITDMGEESEVLQLVEKYNRKIYHKHTGRRLRVQNGHLSFQESYSNVEDIFKLVKSLTAAGLHRYTFLANEWLNKHKSIDDDSKQNAIKHLFAESKISAIYGAAGTGKTTMVKHICSLFAEDNKLLLSQTNTAVQNLRDRVESENATFRTISSATADTTIIKCDVLIIDECSTVSDSDLLKALRCIEFKLLVLVGDEHQIESIRYGRWFSLLQRKLPSSAVFKLKNPYRSTDKNLISLWDEVRGVGPNIAEKLSKGRHCRDISTVFSEVHPEDNHIILCLNYGGIFGINSLNSYMQAKNPAMAITVRDEVYKVGDPIVFTDARPFGRIAPNNSKGKIVSITENIGSVKFTVDTFRNIRQYQNEADSLTVENDTCISFHVRTSGNLSYDHDDVDPLAVLPIRVSYAMSIHRAQGLEYDSVSIVIPEDVEESISHSTFYTAITRAKKSLTIYWSSQVQDRILSSLKLYDVNKTINLFDASQGQIQSDVNF